MPVSRWESETGGAGGADYAKRFADLEAKGVYVHGEADLIASLATTGSRILDAGCGTGRIAIELERRGYDVVGVDVDASMLDQARAAAPKAAWELADLAELTLDHEVDLAVLAGNVMIFIAPGTEAAVLARVSAAVRPGGLVVSGFSLGRLPLEDYDRYAEAAGLTLVDRFSTWDRGEFSDASDYAVTVHRRLSESSR